MSKKADHWFTIISISLLVFVMFASSVDHSVHRDDALGKEIIDAKTGEDVIIGNLTFQVNTTQFRKTILNDFYPKTAEGIFLVVSLIVQNNGDEACLLDSSCFKLINDFGISYEVAYEGSIALDESDEHTLFLKKCKPHSTIKGLLCFDVPKKDEYKLLLKDHLSVARIKLKCK
jgi:hypothetical protein